jgi:Hint domain
MTSKLGNSNSGVQRTRRNIIKMGAIAVPAILASVRSASAGQSGSVVCEIVDGVNDILGTHFPCPTTGPFKGYTGNGGGNCFLRGTKIRTTEGERKIEDLAIGDLLPTMFGGLCPVQWIGHYSYKKSDPSKPWAESARPVRIARSALAPNVPRADLYVTAAHSLLIDGVLVPAVLLINGTTITRYEPEGHEAEFFHVKLESHDVIYAEGAPAETLLNVEESAVNFAEYFRLYGMPTSEETPCLPVIPIHGGRVELVSRARSALSPWIDLRDRADVVRDRLEEGRIMLEGRAEIVGG